MYLRLFLFLLTAAVSLCITSCSRPPHAHAKQKRLTELGEQRERVTTQELRHPVGSDAWLAQRNPSESARPIEMSNAMLFGTLSEIDTSFIANLISQLPIEDSRVRLIRVSTNGNRTIVDVLLNDYRVFINKEPGSHWRIERFGKISQ
jgi:hypothetical protein